MTVSKFLQVRLPQLPTAFQNEEALEIVGVYCFGLMEFILLFLGNRTHFFSLGNQPWMWSKPGHKAHLCWLRCSVGVSTTQTNVISADPGTFQGASGRRFFLSLWTWSYVHVSLEKWSTPWEWSQLAMKQHRMAQPQDADEAISWQLSVQVNSVCHLSTDRMESHLSQKLSVGSWTNDC